MEKDFVKVHTTNDPYQADIARDILSENNINSVILDQHDSMFPAIGEIEVYVHENDEAAALEILKTLKS
ncbi:MAG: DUF2007 domain-containing protein [Prolixibacteraceae bacterium]